MHQQEPAKEKSAKSAEKKEATSTDKSTKDKGQAAKLMKSKAKTAAPAQTDKYSFIDAEIESEMGNQKMDQIKEGEYYDKVYVKDHES